MIENYLKNEMPRDILPTYKLSELTELPVQVEQLDDKTGLEHMDAERSMEATEQQEKIIGCPCEDMETWSPQSEEYSCAIACQEMIAEQLTGKDISEEKMIAFAKEQGWYDPESGTTMHDVGRLLEEMGMKVERQTDAAINDLAEALNHGKVICGVNNMILSEPALADLPGLRANHAVQVIGIDTTDPKHVEVLLNDPGVENGCGIRHSLDTFLKAWKTSSNFMASVKP